MVYVLSYLCLLAATLSALTLILPPIFVCSAPINNSIHQQSTATPNITTTTNQSSILRVSRITEQTTSVNFIHLLNITSNNTQYFNNNDTTSSTTLIYNDVGVNTKVISPNRTKISDANNSSVITYNLLNKTKEEDSAIDTFSVVERSRADRLPRHVNSVVDSNVSSDLISRASRSLRTRHQHHNVTQNNSGDVNGDTTNGSDDNIFVDDTGGRNERSTNLSHITGTSRKIQMYVTNRLLQILTDGTVNGTSDDNIYTILQRIPVKVGQLRIQGIATCQYLCIDACGILYGSRDFNNEDCVFNEMIETNHYNTYSSAKYSNKNRTMYLALNKSGQPRKVLLKTTPGDHYLGKMASYTRVLTRAVKPERMDELETEMLHTLLHNSNSNPTDGGVATGENGVTQHPLRHHGSHQMLCPPIIVNENDDRSTINGKNTKFRCRKRKKRKKKRRKPIHHPNPNRNKNDETVVPKHRKQCSNKNPSSNINNPENPNQKSKEGIGSGTNRTIILTTDSEINSNYNNSNNTTTNTTSITSHHSNGGLHNSPPKRKGGIGKKQFVFTFNGVTHTDCDQYKNANKHRKCEEALRRQKAKTNFHIGEVGDQIKKQKNVVHNNNNNNDGIGIKNQGIACKYTANNMATVVSSSPTVNPVFGDAMVSSSYKHTFTTTVDTDHDDTSNNGDWINEPVTESDFTDFTATDFDDGSDLFTASTQPSTLRHHHHPHHHHHHNHNNHKSLTSSNHNIQVPQLTPQAPPPFNDLDEFDEFEDISSLIND